MAHELLQVDSDPAQAVAEIREASRSRPVLVFKRSPICPVSHRAEFELRKYLEGLGDDASLAVVDIDVIGAKPLARGLTQTLGIDHESPQALWFDGGELVWHGSHSALTVSCFSQLQSGQTPA